MTENLMVWEAIFTDHFWRAPIF